jgi:hypothetical protein
MNDVALFCKSYRQDVLRARRLAASVERHNSEGLRFCVSVPRTDLPLFRDHLSGLPVEIICDEEIIAASPRIDPARMKELPGGQAQQVVKSEFWRLNIAATYLCLDSDCEFIRPFGRSDLVSPEGHPYTVMHEAKELLQFALNHGMDKIYGYFHQERQQIMSIFGRSGRPYDFGPLPAIWSAEVWRALDEQFLAPKGMSFLDAIVQFPSEMQWYGEAMLKYRPFPLLPVEPLFKVYHYEPQFLEAQRLGETPERLAKNFLGVCYQSNWEKGLDLEHKRRSAASRAARWVRRNVFKRYK